MRHPCKDCGHIRGRLCAVNSMTIQNVNRLHGCKDFKASGAKATRPARDKSLRLVKDKSGLK